MILQIYVGISKAIASIPMLMNFDDRLGDWLSNEAAEDDNKMCEW